MSWGYASFRTEGKCFCLNFNESAVHVWDVASWGEVRALDRPGLEAAQLCGVGSSPL